MHTTEKAEIRRIQNVIAVANEAMVCVKDLYSQHPYTHMREEEEEEINTEERLECSYICTHKKNGYTRAFKHLQYKHRGKK